MISRLLYDPVQAKRDGRQGKLENLMSPRQAVMLDPWENDDCARAVGVAFMIGPIALDQWTRIPANMTSIWQGNQGKKMVRILEDPFNGSIYYRRPVDIERQLIWNENREFRISADQWWDNDEMNEWWKKTYPGIYWFKLAKEVTKDSPTPRHTKFIIEASDPSAVQQKLERVIKDDYTGIISFGEKLYGPYPSQELAEADKVPFVDFINLGFNPRK